jgi:uncharacterized protein (DUF1810 family)
VDAVQLSRAIVSTIMATANLERFVEAQDAGAAFERALGEIRAGRKRGHWIWYMFPQLASLGMSAMSQTYGIRDREEAEAYLRHPVLGPRLLTITIAAAEQMRRGARIETLMAAPIDATKLVSSLTLFERVAAGMRGTESDVPAGALETIATEVLAAAAEQGYPRCQRTLAAIVEPPHS